MILAQTIVTYIYYIITAIIGITLLKKFFKREKRQGLVYDLVYAYCLVPFILRLLQIK
jgi:hypothetical protein